MEIKSQNNKYKINKYLSKLINTKNINKRNIYEKKYIYHKNLSQFGGTNKDKICSDKEFKNDEIIKEIYSNDLLIQLHTNVLSSQRTTELDEYETEYNKLSSLVLIILNKIKTKTFELEIKPLTLVSHYYRNKNFPPKMLAYINSEEKKELIQQIKEYQNKILKIEKIGYFMCSLLYDVYVNQFEKSHNLFLNENNVELFRYILKESINYFDNSDDIKQNFFFFHNTFSDNFKIISRKLNTEYLSKTTTNISSSCYLILVKIKNKIKFFLDLNKDTKDYIINSLINSLIDIDEKLKEKNTSKIFSENRIKELESSIVELENLIKDNNNEKNRDQFLVFINDYREMIDSYKENKNNIEKEILLYINNNYTIDDEAFDDYKEKLNYCFSNKKNVLVPIMLLDISQEKTQINNISNYIKNHKDPSYKFKLHSNMLFINNKNKYIEHFEPHGISGFYDSSKVFDVLESIHKKIPDFNDYTFYKQSETCPIVEGPQYLDRTEYCYIHSGYYSFLRILYPDISSEELQMMLISKINPEFKEDIKINPSFEYLNKKYIRLNGYEIKTRLENFMRWYRSIVLIYDTTRIQEEFIKVIKQISNTPLQMV